MPQRPFRGLNAAECDGSPPRLPWIRVALFTGLIFLMAVGGLEAYWRGRGYRPSIEDRPELWHFWRQRVYTTHQTKKIVLLGTSRIQTDLVPAVLQRAIGLPVVQLAVKGATSPIGILHELAADEDFNGLIVCSLYVPLIHRTRWQDADPYSKYRPTKAVNDIETLLSLRLRSLATLKNQMVAPYSLLQAMLSETTIREPEVLTLSFDRSLNLRSALLPPIRHAASRLSEQFSLQGLRVSNFNELESECTEINRSVRKIRARGGDVIFVHLPSSGADDAEEEKAFPKVKYWDRFSRVMSARCIHFKDVPTLSCFVCADGRHLSEDDSPQFTEALAREIMKDGVIQN
jgi:hypothetical protein